MVYNPLKNFDWAVEMDGQIVGGGYNDLLQDITLPSPEYTVTVHGAAGGEADVETPNKKKLSDMVIKKLFRNDLPDNDGWARLSLAGLGLPGAYLFDMNILVYGAAKRIVKKYSLYNCWVKKVEYSNLMASNADADNLFETLTLFVQDMKVS